jgi:hypothetical protein
MKRVWYIVKSGLQLAGDRCRQVEQHHLSRSIEFTRQDGRGAWHSGIGLSPWPHDVRSRASSSQPFIHSSISIPFLPIACERDERSVVCTVHAVAVGAVVATVRANIHSKPPYIVKPVWELCTIL